MLARRSGSPRPGVRQPASRGLGSRRGRGDSWGRMSRENWQSATEENSKLGAEPFAELCRKVVRADHRGLVRAVALPSADRRAAGDRARRSSSSPARRVASARSRRWACASSTSTIAARRAIPCARPPRLGAGAHPRGRGCRCRASGGDEAGDAGRPRAQAGAVPPRGRAHDRARLARLRHGPLLRLYRAGGAAPDGVDAAQALAPTCWWRTPTTWRCCAGAASTPARGLPSWAGRASTPQAFPAMPPPGNDVPVAAFVGRMIRPKGIDVLMQALRPAEAARRALRLELYGGDRRGQPRGDHRR